MLGIVISTYDDAEEDELAFGSSVSSMTSEQVAFYIDKKLGAFSLETRFGYSRDRHAIFAIDIANGEIAPLVAPGAGGLLAPAGMAFGPDGKLYVCSRETKQILRFDATTGVPDSTPFIDHLEDFPEFISLVG